MIWNKTGLCIGPYNFKKNIILFFKIDVKIKLLVILIVIMGVAYYYSWIIKNHKNIINKCFLGIVK